jgi:hypothetical protein
MAQRLAATLRPLHPPNAAQSHLKRSLARNIEIPVHDPLDHAAPAILHEPTTYISSIAKGAAVVLISGAGGGVSGPAGEPNLLCMIATISMADRTRTSLSLLAGIYPSLAHKFASLLAIPCVRLDYRQPARNRYCTPDVLASMDSLAARFGSTQFVLVGWSFGGAPCFTVAAREPTRVVGVATVASQTAETDGVAQLAPRPLLLLHGTGDTTLSPRCAQSLYHAYGEHPKGQREMRLFDGDDHGLTKNAVEVEKLIFGFAARCLGLHVDTAAEEKAGRDLVGSVEERVREMQEGHDLENGEHL